MNIALTATRSLRLPELLPVLGCVATVSGAGFERRQARRQGEWGVGVVRVAELVGVTPEVVQLFLAARVLYVLEPAASADTRISRGSPSLRCVVGFEQDGTPPGGGVPLEHRPQGAPVRVAWRLCASQVREGWQVVGVEDQLLGIAPRSDAGSAHQ